MANSAALARTVPRRIVITSVLALGLVAILALATFWVKDVIVARQKLYGEAYQTIQDLRNLTQRTALLASRRLAKADQPDAHIDHQLFADLHELARVHQTLQGMPGKVTIPPALQEAYVAGPRFVDRAVEQHLRTLGRITTSDPAYVQHIIDGASGSLSYALDRFVRQHQALANAELAGWHRLETVLITATLGLLLFELLFVFRPMSRRVREGYRELIDVYETFRAQTFQDELTGLGNRKVLLEALARPLAKPHALLQIDLDHFKTVNDTLGHAVGDQTLVAIAKAIRSEVSTDDLAVRMGGDEFSVLSTHKVTVAQAVDLAERLLSAIDDACPDAAARLGLSASIGIALFPATDPDPSRLLLDADLALHEAKAEGRRRWSLFRPEMRAPVERRQAVEVAFRQSLLRGEVILHYQPQVDLATGAVIGLEALARWRRPDGEVLGADHFIPFIEDGPLIIEMGNRILDVALDMQLELRRLGLVAGPIGLNVADLQLRQPDFASSLLDRVAQAGLGPDAVTIEVVERAFVARGQELIARQLHDLADAGVAVELDDFGTGHASLTHLKTFPVSRIKIDRSFVDGIGRDAGDETIVRATIDIAASMGRRVIAEGIETDAQRRFLLAHGCQEGQGYLISPPLPPSRLIDWLTTQRAAVRHGSGQALTVS
ncbi:MAG: bifunctional diguanylate cyclase/phosphodiesterase [Geminicoccaceae bacterium]|nr:MAG: bifunctional diguanylate cyclase/phosphodiesterase [Geminicoccaceae bacterium]